MANAIYMAGAIISAQHETLEALLWVRPTLTLWPIGDCLIRSWISAGNYFFFLTITFEINVIRSFFFSFSFPPIGNY